jgi:hypothetical protein
MRWTSLALLSLLAPLARPLPAQEQAAALPVITVGGQSFATWDAYLRSPLFRQLGLRCGTRAEGATLELRPQSDCTSSSTTIKPEYEPGAGILYRIPVVVHIIQNTGGQGAISDAMVQSQIDVLNEDFQAQAGTLGENGNNARIEFFLATTDPLGNPTTGITRSTNNTWFNDGGAYYDTLNWDPDEYLNIYTNSASGALGYVPSLPQNGIVGANSDRVVVLWSAFGRNAPIGPPFNLGRTATHEVGHYFGLYHTFDFGCGSAAACYTSGDRICDTAGESSPVFGCPGSSDSCAGGGPDPFHNYMDYSDDDCYEEFTPEQNNRMRCTLANWRVNLHDPIVCGVTASNAIRAPSPNPNVYSATTAVLGGTVTLTVTDPASNTAVIWGYAAPANFTLPSGYVLLMNTASAFYFRLPLALPPDQVVLGVPADAALCGVTAYSQAVLRRTGGVIVHSNAVDLTAGL